MLYLWVNQITFLDAENVSATSGLEGAFAVSWNIPPSAPAGTVHGFCLKQTHRDDIRNSNIVCTSDTEPAPTSTQTDSCYYSRCFGSVHEFRISLVQDYLHDKSEYSDPVSAVSTYSGTVVSSIEGIPANLLALRETR